MCYIRYSAYKKLKKKIIKESLERYIRDIGKRKFMTK